MNRLGMLVAVIQAAAAVEALWSRGWRQATIYAAFSVASAAIALK